MFKVEQSHFDRLREFLHSEEGKQSILDYFGGLNKKQSIMKSQVERLHNSGKFELLLEKSIEKYNSDVYIKRWRSRSIEPPEDLYWFLFNYAKTYGRECNEEEWHQYGNMFSSELFFCNGYIFNQMDGQGSVIKIVKVNKYFS
jgi:hypothetical protein